jgi:hypothetical protein
LEPAIERAAVHTRDSLCVRQRHLTAAKRQVDWTFIDQQPADHDSGRDDGYAATDDGLPAGVVQELAVADLRKRWQQPQGVNGRICRQIAPHRPRAALPSPFRAWLDAGVDAAARGVGALPAQLRSLKALAARLGASFVDVESHARRL